jgi:hypothetical protein
MPQTDFYLCETDIVEITETLFDQGARIVPAIDYSTPEPLEISSRKRFKRFFTVPIFHFCLLFLLAGSEVRCNLDL